MSEPHTHDWTPIPGQCACYACACGAVGNRSDNGVIQETKLTAELAHHAQITARPVADYRTGRVRARIVEDEDFWETQMEL